jgi:pimeloyl-ACP methyl ester carboxylesterase
MSQLPHLLLLPGLACDGDVWAHQVRTFSKISTLNVTDYGLSDSIGKMAEVALDSAPERFAIAGHSMGGRVAFEIVRRAPERVVGMAVLDTAYRPFAGGEAGERERAQRSALLEVAQTKGMRAMSQFWMKGIIHPDRLADQDLTNAILEMMGRKTPQIFAAQIKALLERPDATSVLSAVRCPSMVLVGRQDAWSAIAGHREIAALIPNATLAVIEHCGHMSPMERPEDVTAAMTSWFSALKS